MLIAWTLIYIFLLILTNSKIHAIKAHRFTKIPTMYNILLVEFVVLTANKIIITKLAIATRLRIVRRNAFWLINFKISVINSSSVNPPLFLTSTKAQTELISIKNSKYR